ncbi:hypothetical protein ABZS96_04225 [Streptomyces avermitilis]
MTGRLPACAVADVRGAVAEGARWPTGHPGWWDPLPLVFSRAWRVRA